MSVKNFRDWFVIVIFLIAGAVSWNLYFRIYIQADTVNIHDFPRTIGSWTSEELPISELDYTILETRNAFVRRYSRPSGESLYVFVVYSQNNRKVSHPPEICYTGSGVTVVANTRDSIVLSSGQTSVNVNKLTIERGQAAQLVFYWFKVAEIYTANYWEQQFLIAVRSFLGKPANSALIRISADIQNEISSAPTTRFMKEFGQEFIPLLGQYRP